MTENTPAAEPGSALAELRDDPTSRKRFFRMAGTGVAGGLAVMLAACGSSDDSTSSSTTDTGASTPAATATAADNESDLKILNYALTLEYLETDFYAQVIESGLVKDKNTASLAKAIHATEQAHVDALTKTIESLGGMPAEKPMTKFGPVLDKGLQTVLETAATVENLGAAAYLGQAPKIKSKEILAAALSIHSVEARHAAGLNFLVGRGYTGKNALEGSIPDGAFAAAMEMDAVLAAVKPYLA
jgi:rubrerythrin